MEKELITISKYDYDNLIETKTKYYTLMNTIFYNAHLNYGGSELRFDNDKIETVIIALESENYENKLTNLQYEEERKKAKDKEAEE